MITVLDAQALIAQTAAPLTTERVPLVAVVGRVLAEPFAARRTLPPWDNSAMDGYAVRAAEATTGACLSVAFEVAAGHPSPLALPAGQVARIFTGAPVPAGADSVVMQENTERDGDAVRFTQDAELGRHIRRVGSDVSAGDALFEPGRVLTSGDVGLLAAQGRSGVAVHRRPRVAILASGDELVEVDAGDPAPGQIVNSNTVALAAAVRALGAVPQVLPIVPDTPAATRSAIAAAANGADLLLTTGGVSVGDHDYVGHALRDLGELLFWKVAVKPGKPIAFGTLGNALFYGLPGNPISALVGFELFVRPALLRLMGHARVFRATVPARLTGPMRAGGRREEYVRAALSREAGEWRVDPQRTQSSGALSSLAGADALIQVAPGAPARNEGDWVPVVALGPDRPAERRISPVGCSIRSCYM